MELGVRTTPQPRVSKGHPREQLRGVVWTPRPQPTTPLQESPEGCVGVLRDAAAIVFRPHFQAGQHHLNIQRPENLRKGPFEARISHPPTVPSQSFSITSSHSRQRPNHPTWSTQLATSRRRCLV